MNCASLWASLCVVIFISSRTKAQEQGCLRASNGERPLPNFVRPGEDNETARFSENPIRGIVTSYRFNCCGVITEWRAFVARSGSTQFQALAYSVTFTVWRPSSPSPVDTDGCYAVVGQNGFAGSILADPATSERGILTGIPSEADRIEVQPGDVIGFFLLSNTGSDDGYQFAGHTDNDPAYTNETVWYATGIVLAHPNACPLPVGPDRLLSMSTNRAPLITATVSMSPCSASLNPPTQQATTSTTGCPPPTSSQITPTPIPTDPATTPGLDGDIGLTIGIAVIALVIAITLVGVVVLYCVVRKKKRKTRGKPHLFTWRLAASPTEPVYADAPTTLGTQNPASGGIAMTTEPEYDYVNEGLGGAAELRTERNSVSRGAPSVSEHVYNYVDTLNPAFGDVATTTNVEPATEYYVATTTDFDPDTEYYVNEGLGGAAELRMERNEAYSVSRGAPSDNEPSIPTTENEAYGVSRGAPSDCEPVYNYIDAPTPASGDVATTTDVDPDTEYYVNEGLGGAAELSTERNEAYGVSSGAPSDNEPSIPTTENEAYTSMSANTERAEEEETYDYVQ